MTVNNSIFSFDPFVLNPARRELKRDGEAVDIEPRAFDLLIFLIENRDRAVNKAEIQDAIWPSMIVTETALTRAVMKARKAIGDDANRQELIKTVHGHGYRFIAKVSVEDQATPLPSSPVTQTSPANAEGHNQPPPEKTKLGMMSLAAISALIIVSLSWWLLRPSAEINSTGDMRIAVLPLLDNTENQDLSWTRFGLMSYTTELIANDDSLQVVPTGSIIGLAENFGWNGQLGDPVNQPLLDKLQHVYGATHLLAMELESESGALRMNYSLVTTGNDPQLGTIVGDDGTELAQGVVQAIYGILFRKSHLGGEMPLVSKDAFNNEAFARGMDLSLQGRCKEAVQFFRVIIEQEPSLFAPRFELAACQRINGEQEEAEALLTTLINEQTAIGPTRQLSESLMLLGIVYNRTGRLDQAEQAHQRALDISREIADHVLSARILQNLSIVAKSRSELDEASRLLDLALLAYQDAGREVLPGQLYSGRANLNMARGQLLEADLELQKAVNAFREIGDRRGEAMMLNNTGYLRRLQGRIEEAEAYHLRSLEIRQEIGDRVGVGRIYSMLSGVYSAQGHFQDAKASAVAALEIARETRDRLFEATSLAQLATAEMEMGHLDAARTSYINSREVFVDIQDALRILQTDILLARVDIASNQLDRAQATALEVIKTSREEKIMQAEVEALELLADIELARGNTPAAIEGYQVALERVEETSWASEENTLLAKLAEAYMDIDDLEAAAPLMGALSGDQENIPSLKAQARFAWLRGNSANSIELMSRARTLSTAGWTADDEALLQKYSSDPPP